MHSFYFILNHLKTRYPDGVLITVTSFQSSSLCDWSENHLHLIWTWPIAQTHNFSPKKLIRSRLSELPRERERERSPGSPNIECSPKKERVRLLMNAGRWGREQGVVLRKRERRAKAPTWRRLPAQSADEHFPENKKRNTLHKRSGTGFMNTKSIPEKRKNYFQNIYMELEDKCFPIFL